MMMHAPPLRFQLTSAPPPHTYTQHAYVKYNELYRCYSAKGKEAEECKRIKKDLKCGRGGRGAGQAGGRVGGDHCSGRLCRLSFSCRARLGVCPQVHLP